MLKVLKIYPSLSKYLVKIVTFILWIRLIFYELCTIMRDRKYVKERE